MRRVSIAKEYEAQCLANEGLSRWVLHWSEAGDRYRKLWTEVRLGLVVELKRIARIPAKYRREADREILTLVLRLLYGSPPPNDLDGKRPKGKRVGRTAKLVLISSRNRAPQSRARPQTHANNARSPATRKRPSDG